MELDLIDPADFVACVHPLIQAQNSVALMQLLESRWTCTQITRLLNDQSRDVRKVAALALGLVGGECCVPDLAAQLKNPDPMINQMAEHAMWSIWFRCSTIDAGHELCCGSMALNRKEYDLAIKHFSRALEIDPTFAEAYNQRAIVKYLQERYDESREDCMRAIERMPFHFGAWSGMGHCYAQEGRCADALECYSKALEINPHFCGIGQAVGELKKRLGCSEQ
ncbi:MAG TPA: tetratricopeptide repeat protein [Tepidisphaeraceae bacterium]|jgi:tetratricopeptide (TPR) repeat protein